MIDKVKVTAEVTLVDGSTVTAEDDPANGVMNGQIVRDAILSKTQAVYADSSVEYAIPYHSVLQAEFTKSTVQVTEPVDDTCQ